MRINEQIALITTQPQQNNQPNENELNFEQWITTPTKQNSGDEYYWQHQEQLEQSSLHFNPQPNHQKIWEQIDEPLNSLHLENPISSETTIISPTQTFSNYQSEKFINNLLIEEPLAQSFMQKSQKPPQIMTPIGSSNTRLTIEKSEQPEEIKATAFQQYNNNQFKNHHLFIQDEQVELTLNTKDLTSKEQRELTQAMKDHIKNNGLGLRKLIINGVEK